MAEEKTNKYEVTKGNFVGGKKAGSIVELTYNQAKELVKKKLLKKVD